MRRYRQSSLNDHSFSNCSILWQRWTYGTYTWSTKEQPLQCPCSHMIKTPPDSATPAALHPTTLHSATPPVLYSTILPPLALRSSVLATLMFFLPLLMRYTWPGPAQGSSWLHKVGLPEGEEEHSVAECRVPEVQVGAQDGKGSGAQNRRNSSSGRVQGSQSAGQPNRQR